MQRLLDNAGATVDRPARKPLYLATRAKFRVRAEGESLVVSRDAGACQRFPVARIDRVVCGARADWTGEALALCLARGITVTWVAPDGHAIGDCTPRVARRSGFHDALESYVETPDWRFGYGNWLRRARMTVLIRWARHRLAAGNPVEPAVWEAHKREFVCKAELRSAFAPELNAWCRAAVVARLAAMGLRSRYYGYDGEAMELAEDLTMLVWAGLTFRYGDLLAGTLEPGAVPMAFEAGAAERDRELRDHLARLRMHVTRAVDSWL